MTPCAIGIFSSPMCSRVVSRASTNRRPRRSAASSASRIVAVNAPTRSRWVPGSSHAPFDQRLLGPGGAADDVGLSGRGGEVCGDLDDETFRSQLGGERLGARRRPVPDEDLLDRGPDAEVRPDQRSRQRAGADHEQAARIGAGQIARSEGGIRRGLPGGDAGAVDHGERAAVVVVEQHEHALHRGQRRRAVGIAEEAGDGLDADAVARLPGGAAEQDVAALLQQHVVGLPAPEPVAGIERVDQGRPGQHGIDPVLVDDEHGPQPAMSVWRRMPR